MSKRRQEQRKDAERRNFKTSPRPNSKNIAAVCVCVAMAGWGLLEYAGSESIYQRQHRDPYYAAKQEDRFTGLLSAVPPEAVLGFITDLQAGSTAALALHNVAQYHLAPRLLVDGAQHDLVLGDFASPGDFAALGAAMGLTIEKDFGSGIVLFRRSQGK
jgi:hypothetical protein